MAATTDKKEHEKKPDLGLLEEDDEFEEFPTEGKNCVGFNDILKLCFILIKIIKVKFCFSVL